MNCPYVTTSEFLNSVPPWYSVFNVSLVNFNVRSLNRNGTYLDALLESVNIPIDITVLTESWVTPDTIEMSNINGYLDYHTIRDNSRGGGVEILWRNTLQSSQIINLSQSEPHIESCIVTIKSGADISSIIGVYRPPLGDVDLFLLSLEEILQHKYSSI